MVRPGLVSPVCLSLQIRGREGPEQTGRPGAVSWLRVQGLQAAHLSRPQTPVGARLQVDRSGRRGGVPGREGPGNAREPGCQECW